MKKIFVIDINEKDKKLTDKKFVMSLEKLFTNIAKDINDEKSIYIKLKRVGSIWDNILNSINKISEKK